MGGGFGEGNDYPDAIRVVSGTSLSWYDDTNYVICNVYPCMRCGGLYSDWVSLFAANNSHQHNNETNNSRLVFYK